MAHLGMTMEKLDVPIRTGQRIWILEVLDIIEVDAPVHGLSRSSDAGREAITNSKAFEVDGLARGTYHRIVKPRIDKQGHIYTAVTLTNN
jgi:hypothetical protein